MMVDLYNVGKLQTVKHNLRLFLMPLFNQRSDAALNLSSYLNTLWLILCTGMGSKARGRLHSAQTNLIPQN